MAEGTRSIIRGISYNESAQRPKSLHLWELKVYRALFQIIYFITVRTIFTDPALKRSTENFLPVEVTFESLTENKKDYFYLTDQVILIVN